MFMSFLMFRRIYCFTAACGGVYGKAAGIAHDIMTDAGRITKVCRLYSGLRPAHSRQANYPQTAGTEKSHIPVINAVSFKLNT
jgi:hypothetical protein